MKKLLLSVACFIGFKVTYSQIDALKISSSYSTKIDSICQSIDALKLNWRVTCGDGISKKMIHSNENGDTLLKWSISLIISDDKNDSMDGWYSHEFYYQNNQLIKAIVSMDPFEDYGLKSMATYYFMNNKMIGSQGKFVKEIGEQEIINCSDLKCYSLIKNYK